MRSVPTKDRYFLDMALATSRRSKDPNTQVGAVIVNNDGRIVSLGYNGMPEGIPEDDHCWHDHNKDDLVVHAEVNAIANAARAGVCTLGGTMYVTLPPCLPCARVLVAGGIQRVMFPEAAYYDWIERKPHWAEHFAASLEFLSLCKTQWRMV